MEHLNELDLDHGMKLPFDVDVAGFLSRQEVAVLQNHVFSVPDDDSQLVPEHTLLVSCPVKQEKTSRRRKTRALTLLVSEVKCPLKVQGGACPWETCRPTSGLDPTHTHTAGSV